MPAYRFYTLPRSYGDSPIEQIFYKDSVAMRWAFKQADAAGVEIWQGSRFIGRLHGRAPSEESDTLTPPGL